MLHRNCGSDKRYILGGILIVLGGLFLLNTLDIVRNFDFWDVIFSWGFVLFALGLYLVINSWKKQLGGFFMVLGAFLLLKKFFPELPYGPSVIIPLILIALGIHLILKRRRMDINGADNISNVSNISKDHIDDVSIFGGGNKIISSNNFKGGNITAIFGGSEINLMNCQLAQGDNVLDVLCVFGGTTIIVPKEWNIVVNVTSILGGFSNKSIRNPSIVIDQSRTLHIKGLAMFGGGEIKTYL